jgi:hypothetical protein
LVLIPAFLLDSRTDLFDKLSLQQHFLRIIKAQVSKDIGTARSHLVIGAFVSLIDMLFCKLEAFFNQVRVKSVILG